MRAARDLPGGPVDWLDRVALVGSAACTVHCVALPVIVAALPALSSMLSLPEFFHVGVLAIAAPAAGIALVLGRARHRATYPLLLGGAGVVLLALGAFALPEGASETVATVCGSLLLAAAHTANWILRRACCGAVRPPGRAGDRAIAPPCTSAEREGDARLA